MRRVARKVYLLRRGMAGKVEEEKTFVEEKVAVLVAG
jgi:hypothetical protein